MSLILITKLVSLTLLLWLGPVNIIRGLRSQSVPTLNFIASAMTAVIFIWSMGWLS